VKVESVPEAINNLKNEVSNLSSRLKEKTAEVYALKLQEFLAQAPMTSNGYKVVCVTEETDSVGAKLLMQQLSEENDLLVAIFAHSGARINYQFAVTLGAAGDCRKYIAKANELFNGKGGGKPEFAQGGANYCGNWQILAQQVADYMQREE
jgi:alanyl-tRNA synthetase